MGVIREIHRMTLKRVWVLCGGYKRDTQNDIEQSMGAVWGL